MKDEIKSTLSAAGMTQGEFAQLVNLSRVIVNRYLNKGVVPLGNNEARIKRALAALKVLVKKGKLPLPEDADKERRTKAVAKIKAHLDATA